MEVILSPIEVIVGFKPDGKLYPIRFRVFNKESSFETISIKNISRNWSETIGKENIDFFRCHALIDNYEKLLELKFESTNGQWQLYK